ncbi:PTS sugar transporter subunit IIB [Sedimentibacter sp. zth1]|uniref:PTS sugar transporter subunit IIB n=1 Tax=Sedimentibacter sp. zth1 TaxID=2816908 RepID=UPI001A921B1D|nr:PTS sugar transporter subunit IIB [Sedimentibacter sp. zth1]QSX06971.1 PTS sugar transporter subunit IIB [Sedimentibacter sp. zth1]
MKNVILARIDDRLLHGQVVVSWIPKLNVNEVLVIDDESAQDEFLKELIKATAPDNILVNILTINESISYLSEQTNGEKILILTKKISNLCILINNNIDINRINLGGLGFNNDRTRYLNFISLNDEEKNLLIELDKSKKCSLEIQMVPNDKKYILSELLKG